MFTLFNTFLKHVRMGHTGMGHSDRFMLWIDSVGGYWVCLGREAIIGCPDGSEPPDIPLLGDLSSKHARIYRDGEGYLIEALRDTRVDSRAVERFDWLREGSRIELGSAVRLLFTRPHPLSSTARLDAVSRHRTQPSSDAVLLMADACVLGPSPQSHVICHEWPCEILLFRRDEQLYCRAKGRFQIDGRVCDGEGSIAKLIDNDQRQTHRIEGDGFTFSLEWLP